LVLHEMTQTFDVFISHSSRDSDFSHRLATDLMAAGLKVWLDKWELRAGDSIAAAVEQAIGESRYLLLVMSPDYFQSAWTMQEWRSALASELDGRGVKAIPVMYRDCDVPPLLAQKLFIDFRDPESYEVSLRTLIRGLKSLETKSGKQNSPEAPNIGAQVSQLDEQAQNELRKLLDEALRAFRDNPIPATKEEAPVPTDPDLCFVVMPFSVPELGIVYEDFVKPILEDKCRLRVERGDDELGSNVIMEDITKSIRRARIIVADLTGRNANVFYEVGIAHALNKPVLLMTQSIDDVPFDLRHRRALVYEYSPRGCKRLETSLYENVQSILGPSGEA
jgi:TIR domain